MSTALEPPLALLLVYMSNIISTPPSLEYSNRRKINTGNKAFSSRVLSADSLAPSTTFPLPSGGTCGPFYKLFLLCGFEHDSSSTPPSLVLNPAVDADKSAFASLRTAIWDEMSSSLGEGSVSKAPRAVPLVAAAPPRAGGAPEFDVYSSSRHALQKGPEGGGQKSKTTAELERLRAEQQRKLGGKAPGELVSCYVTDGTRRGPATTAADDVGGAGDGALLGQSLKRSMDAAKRREAGFTTRAMREVDSLKKASVYKTTRLLLVLPDGNNVSVEFYNGRDGSGGKAWDVIKEVKGRLFRDEVEFGLFVSPPRQEVDMGKTWKEQGLVPTGKCFLYWKSGYDPSDVGYLRPGAQWGAAPAAVPQGEKLSAAPAPQEGDDKKKPASSAVEAKKKKKKGLTEEELIAKMMGKKKM